MNTQIYGRESELDHLRKMLAGGRSFLIHGPTGVGKTLLLKCLTPEFGRLLYCENASSSQGVFQAIAVALHARKNRAALQVFGKDGPATIKNKSAVALRGVVSDALTDGQYCLVLDHIKRPSQAFSSAIKDVCLLTNSQIVVAARSAHMEDVGFLLPLFPERSDKFCLRNLAPQIAREFAHEVGQRMKLEFANQEETIRRIAEYSEGNPGAIRAMLGMAADPRYVVQQHLKLTPLYLDFRMKGVSHG
jgi:DNA polymerase III delta prime subunit